MDCEIDSKITLKNLTAEKLVKILPQDAIEILVEKFLTTKKRIGHLVQLDSDRGKCDGIIFTDVISYEGSTEEILSQMTKDPRIGLADSFYVDLLEAREETLKKDPHFKNVVDAVAIGWGYTIANSHKYIEYLYTEVLTLDDFITDLSHLDLEGDYRAGYLIVFEDEFAWEHIKDDCIVCRKRCIICKEMESLTNLISCPSCNAYLICSECGIDCSKCNQSTCGTCGQVKDGEFICQNE